MMTTQACQTWLHSQPSALILVFPCSESELLSDGSGVLLLYDKNQDTGEMKGFLWTLLETDATYISLLWLAWRDAG